MKEFFLNILEWCATKGITLVVTLLVTFLAWKLINIILKKIFDGKKDSNLDPTLAKFLKSFIGIALKIILIIIAVSVIGFDTSALVAILATAGATIGLALQGGLSNLAGGVILIIMRPFKIGNFITAGGQSGTVVEIGIFYTTLITVDNQKVFLPNGTLTGSAIVNVTAEDTRRVDMTFTVSKTSDIKMVKKILAALAANDERVLEDPATAVVITKYYDGKVDVQLRMWCNTSDYWDLYFDMQESVKEAFDVSGIVMPYNQVIVQNAEEDEE